LTVLVGLIEIWLKSMDNIDTYTITGYSFSSKTRHEKELEEYGHTCLICLTSERKTTQTLRSVLPNHCFLEIIVKV